MKPLLEEFNSALDAANSVLYVRTTDYESCGLVSALHAEFLV